MSFQTTFTSNNKYFSWMFIFLLLLIIFSSTIVISFGFYVYYRYQYFKYAREKRQIKRELMKIKDTEYSNFLLHESEHYKSLKMWN